LLNTQGSSVVQSQSYLDPNRAAQTEAELARFHAIADRTLRAVPRSGLTVDEFLRDSSVSTTPGADLLTFSVKSTDPRLAVQLTSAYAHAFARYELQAQTANLRQKLAGVVAAISELQARRVHGGATYAKLLEERRDLTAALTLQTPPAVVRNDAHEAFQLGPRPGRNGVIAAFLGVVVGVMVVFLSEALDPRVRSAEAVRQAWELPLLGELPRPPRRTEKEGALVMLDDPTSHHAERFRVLRASLDFANSKARAQTIAVTSGVDGEGKSTTAANLAVALARAGKRIVLIDGDLRNPSLHRMFGVEASPGLVDVAVGDVELGSTMRQIDLGESIGDGTAGAAGKGRLELLPAGPPLHDPDQLGADAAIARVAEELRHRADTILIDTPPLLPLGDTIALSAHVDALLLVAQPKMLNTAALERTRRILEATPAAKLGFILTGADGGDAQYRPYPYDRDRGPAAAEPKVRAARPGAEHGNGAAATRGRGGLRRRPRA
jgi:capsular exopolysaccharide synthesis family protein